MQFKVEAQSDSSPGAVGACRYDGQYRRDGDDGLEADGGGSDAVAKKEFDAAAKVNATDKALSWGPAMVSRRGMRLSTTRVTGTPIGGLRKARPTM